MIVLNMNEVYNMFQTLPLSLILLCKINVDALEYKHSPKYTPGGMHVQTLKQHTFSYMYHEYSVK